MTKLNGVLHLHTTYSYDGKLSLDELKGFLVEHNVQFALITEHTDEMTKDAGEEFIAACREKSDERIVLVPGFEVPYGGRHILMVGAHRFVRGGIDNTSDDIREWRNAVELAVFAHPHRNDFSVDRTMEEILDGIEVWNSQYDGKFTPRFKSLALLRRLERRGKKMRAYAGLDLHREEHEGGPRIAIENIGLSYGDIMNALKNGRYTLEKGKVFVSSEGNVLGNILFLRVKSLFFIGIVSFLKRVSRYTKALGIPVPQKLRRRIRSKL